MVGIILFVCLFVCGGFFAGLNIELLFRTNRPKTNIQRPHIFVSIILLINGDLVWYFFSKDDSANLVNCQLGSQIKHYSLCSTT